MTPPRALLARARAATISNPMPYAAIHQPHRVERLHLPVLRTLKASLRLVWSKRQAAVRPFLDAMGQQLATVLSGPTPAA